MLGIQDENADGGRVDTGCDQGQEGNCGKQLLRKLLWCNSVAANLAKIVNLKVMRSKGLVGSRQSICKAGEVKGCWVEAGFPA